MRSSRQPRLSARRTSTFVCRARSGRLTERLLHQVQVLVDAAARRGADTAVARSFGHDQLYGQLRRPSVPMGTAARLLSQPTDAPCTTAHERRALAQRKSSSSCCQPKLGAVYPYPEFQGRGRRPLQALSHSAPARPSVMLFGRGCGAKLRCCGHSNRPRSSKQCAPDGGGACVRCLW